ncbi:hypothetical protein [Streptomyces ardesiacus]|uniref:hypothetical protein n=1 Tax=Streptomyces ardesiacus TaxID=285564 RepID=UPI0036CDF509
MELRMWAPRTVWIAWVVDGCFLAAGGLIVWVTQTRFGPRLGVARGKIMAQAQAQELSASAVIVMSAALVVSVVCGALHALARRRHRDAKRARVLDAEQQLTACADGV